MLLGITKENINNIRGTKKTRSSFQKNGFIMQG